MNDVNTEVAVDDEMMEQSEHETTDEGKLYGTPRFAHNIMDVLLPAKPPAPVNARVIRLERD